MTKKKKKVLVTGGGGYIGVVLTETLLRKGYDVRILDVFLFGKQAVKHLEGKIEIVKGDIRNIRKDILCGIDAVIHQAGLSNDPMAEFNPEANRQINTDGTLYLAKLCKGTGIKRFTFASSASIYNRGILKRTVIQDEDSIVRPKAAYSVSKLNAENGLIAMADKDFCPVIIRQGTVYGFSPRMRYDLVVNTMVKTALDERKIYVFCGGVQWRPLVDVSDVAMAHIYAIEANQKNVSGQIFNLFYKNYRIIVLANIVQKAIKRIKNYEVEIIIDHAPKKDRSYRLSGQKIAEILHFIPEISVEKSISTMVADIEKYCYTDFSNHKYYNIRNMKANIKLLF